MKEKKRRFSLAAKLNLVTIVMILTVAAGLLCIGYFIQAKLVTDLYYRRAAEAAAGSAEVVNSDSLEYLKEWINTDEFRRIRVEAIEAGDDNIITDWMHGIRGASYTEEEYLNAQQDESLSDRQRSAYSLFRDYSEINNSLTGFMNDSMITYAYIQDIRDGVFFTVVDPDLGPCGMGMKDENVPELAKYKENQRIPPTVYFCSYGWLCTAYEPITDPDTGEIIALAGIDISMNQIHQARHVFLINSIVFVVLLAVVCILINLYLIRRIAVRPLQKLTDATCGFADGEQGYTMDDVIHVDIDSNDEINDLYDEIRRMQTRIVRYTNDVESLTAEKARLNTEMQLAAGIQNAMLQSDFPVFPERGEFELYASMDPAREVGGDFYDFFLLDEDHLALLIADVSGKGVPGALFMMSSMILLRTRAAAGGTPAGILADINDQISANAKTKMFVTVWLGILDIRTGLMTCANAGHEYPVISGEDGFRLLKDKHGLVVGGMEGIRYTDYQILLAPGDILFLYTDGVPEATNSSLEFYGTDRMLEALNEERPEPPRDALRTVRRSVDAFTEGSEQSDDLTMLCIKYNGNI